VPEGPATKFFESLGYLGSPGGVIGLIDESPAPTPRAEVRAARALMAEASPAWWSEAEERMTFSEPRLAMSADHKALCLADPGKGVGPLFFTDEASAKEAVKGALSLAQGGRRLSDWRGAEWWTKRFRVADLVRCREFHKDLRGASHA